MIYSIGDNEPFEGAWKVATYFRAKGLLLIRGKKDELVGDLRMLVSAYQLAAAIRPLAASWKKEMSRAPRRKGKQHKKWRAGMMRSGEGRGEG